jgi:hypothetical protein
LFFPSNNVSFRHSAIFFLTSTVLDIATGEVGLGQKVFHVSGNLNAQVRLHSVSLTSIFPVTAAVMSAVRYSCKRAMASSTFAAIHLIDLRGLAVKIVGNGAFFWATWHYHQIKPMFALLFKVLFFKCLVKASRQEI